MRSLKSAVFTLMFMTGANLQAQSSDSLIVQGKAMIAAALRLAPENPRVILLDAISK